MLAILKDRSPVVWILDVIGWLPNPSLIALHLRRTSGYIFRCAQSPVVEFWVQNPSFSLDPMVFLNLPVSCCFFSPVVVLATTKETVPVGLFHGRKGPEHQHRRQLRLPFGRVGIASCRWPWILEAVNAREFNTTWEILGRCRS